MTTTHLITGAVVVGLALQGAITTILPDPTPHFMTVHGVDQVGEMVQPNRTVHGTATRPFGRPVVADWLVTVVSDGEEAPSCQTVTGQDLNAGWSVYVPGSGPKGPMHLDVWVGDPGCWERLTPGVYTEFTTWRPRDGSDPVWFKRTFVKGSD